MPKTDDEYYVVVLDVSISDNMAGFEHCYKPTKQEVVDFNSALQKVNYLLRADAESFMLFDFACQRYRELSKTLEAEYKNVPRPNNELAKLQINAEFLTVLNFMKTYLDYASTRHYHGLTKDEKSKAVYKLETNVQFDSSFAYRFCSKLRDFAQHCGFPITGVDASSGFIPGTQDVEHSFRVSFEPSYLLESFDGWGNILKPELSKMKDPIEVLPTVDELYGAMTELHKKLLKEVVSRLTNEYEIIKQFYQYTHGKQGTPLLIRIHGKRPVPGGKEMKIEQTRIPTELLKLIEEVRDTT